MTVDQKVTEVLDMARREERLFGDEPAGPLEQLLVAAIALGASQEDAIGISDEHVEETNSMRLRLIEMYKKDKGW